MQQEGILEVLVPSDGEMPVMSVGVGDILGLARPTLRGAQSQLPLSVG